MWKRRTRTSSTDPIAVPFELDDEALSKVYGGTNPEEAMPGDTGVTSLNARAQALMMNPTISEMDRVALQSALVALNSFTMTGSGNQMDFERTISELERKYPNLF